MKVSEVMSTPVSHLTPDRTLQAAVELMSARDIGCVPIVDGRGRLRGIVTDRDICMTAHLREVPLSKLRLSDAMTQTVHTVAPDDSLEFAEALMQRHQVRRVPVVDEQDRVIGMLTLANLARVWLKSHGSADDHPVPGATPPPS